AGGGGGGGGARLQTARGLAALLEGRGDRGGRERAGDTLLEQLLAETAAADAAASRARLGPEACEGRVVHVATRGELDHHVARDVVGGASALEAGGGLSRAPRRARP